MRQAGLPLTRKQALPTTTLLHGDCLEVMPTLPTASVQMVFADLPYQITHHKYDVRLNLIEFSAACHLILPRNGVLVCTGSSQFVPILLAQIAMPYKYDLIWQKTRPTGFLLAKKMPMRSHEQVFVFYRSQPTYNPQMVDVGFHGKTLRTQEGKPIKIGPSSKLIYRRQQTSNFRYPASVLAIPSVCNGKRNHPAEKPIALLEWLIKTYTNEGDTVLDPTAGSGTTAVAALRTGRHSICIEKDKGYYDIMCKRVADERTRLEAEP